MLTSYKLTRTPFEIPFSSRGAVFLCRPWGDGIFLRHGFKALHEFFEPFVRSEVIENGIDSD
jgi:hypothetical protein